MRDQYLSVTACARTDADRRYGYFLRDQIPETCGHSFKHNAETASLFENERVFHKPFCGQGGLALRAESTKLIDRLRCESEMPHHWNPCAGDGTDGIRAFASAFELDRVHAALLQEAAGITRCLLH